MKIIDADLLTNIIEEIKYDFQITENKLAQKYGVSERTIRRYIKILKDNGKLKLINNGKKKKWKLND